MFLMRKMLTLSKFASGVVIRGWYVIFYHNKNKAIDLKIRHKNILLLSKNTFLHVGLVTVILVISRPFSFEKITKRILHD